MVSLLLSVCEFVPLSVPVPPSFTGVGVTVTVSPSSAGDVDTRYWLIQYPL